MTTPLETEPTIDVAFNDYVRDTQRLVDAKLDQLLPAVTVPPRTVHAAIRWSVFAGGKRFRPLLARSVGECFGADTPHLLSTACALEMIHTYSLIHDDLPSMDDDDLRRGRATCHIRFGEATAILAGDALQALAFKSLAQDESLSAEKRTRVVNEIAGAAGTPAGMVAGQAHDLEAESRDVPEDELETIHRLKTGALIIAAARCGAIIADASQAEMELITRYASQLGLLFQITDDLLDVTSTAETLGKTPGKDMRARKATYPKLHGVKEAQALAEKIHTEARATLNELTQPTDRLHSIADYILRREA